MKRKKSWAEKLNDAKGLPKTGEITGRMTKKWGTGTMVIPAPLEVDQLMGAVPKGKLATIDTLRLALAKKHKVNICCPLTTGIFAWIAAHAAEEARGQGAKRTTPYWRTLKAKGELNPKYPGGYDGLIAKLKEEGHQVVSKGKKFYVRDYEKALLASI